MNQPARLAAWGVLLVLAALVAWRIVATAVSDRFATENPTLALQWDDENPAARLALAQRQLDDGDTQAARQSVLEVLHREPLAGQAFVLLNKIAVAEQDAAQATVLAEIALRRSPHAIRPLAWLAASQLGEGRYVEALASIDRLLRVSPGQRQTLFPMLIELAGKPDFAVALAARLAEKPVWRDIFVSFLMSKGNADTIERVLGELQNRNALASSEAGVWIDRLAQRGQWGEAYARWVGELDDEARKQLADIYNGGFEKLPTGSGFDWHLDDAAGVVVVRDAIGGNEGSAGLRVVFLGHRVDSVPVHQWLILPAGKYRLHFRAAAQDLRGDRGVQWVLRCQQRGKELAASEPLGGTFDWSEHAFAFEVPEQGCVAQDLSLRNAGSQGAGKYIHGAIRFDDVGIDRLGEH